MTFVVDASVAIKWFVEEDQHEDAIRFLLDHAPQLVAPDLFVVEMTNVVWKKCIQNEIEPEQTGIIISAIPIFISGFWPSVDLAERALDIALTLRHPAYDCFYLACAEAAEGRLVTADQRLLRSVQDSRFADLIVTLDGLRVAEH